jgi:hypothetical protein
VGHGDETDHDRGTSSRSPGGTLRPGLRMVGGSALPRGPGRASRSSDTRGLTRAVPRRPFDLDVSGGFASPVTAELIRDADLRSARPPEKHQPALVASGPHSAKGPPGRPGRTFFIDETPSAGHRRISGDWPGMDARSVSRGGDGGDGHGDWSRCGRSSRCRLRWWCCYGYGEKWSNEHVG